MTAADRLAAVDAELAAIKERQRKLNARKRLLELEKRALEAEREVEHHRQEIEDLKAARISAVEKAVKAAKLAEKQQIRLEELGDAPDRSRLRAVSRIPEAAPSTASGASP